MRSLDLAVAVLAGLYELLELLVIFIIVFAVAIGLPLAVASLLGWAMS